jgi:hypothetical protein
MTFLKDMGNLSPKDFHPRIFIHGCVSDSRLAPVVGWQLDSKPFGNTNCRPKTGANRLSPM